MKIGKYLKFHFKCLKTGRIPNDGLCCCFENRKMELMEPTYDDLIVLMHEGLATTYWGYGCSWSNSNSFDRRSKYTPLRQTIVLLMAAMNGEL